MKRLIQFCFILLPVSAFSQNNNPTQGKEVVIDFKTYGYIGGKRLDSVDARFAEFNWRNLGEVAFDYGQSYEKRKELLITDNKGAPLEFQSFHIAFLLNFFYFNGWQPAKISIDAGQTQNILRKN